MKKISIAVLVISLIFANFQTMFAAAGDIDSSFSTGTGFTTYLGSPGAIYAIAQQSDGKILVGGQFDTYNGVSVGKGIVRLTSTGALDTSFVTGSGVLESSFGNDLVGAIAIQSDGKILIGGNFDTYNGVTGPNGFMRLNSDGSADAAFNSNLGFGFTNGSVTNVPYVRAIKIQSDGKILVGGNFTTLNSTTAYNKLARLNTDGTADGSLASPTGGTAPIHDIALLSNGKIFIAGGFNTYGGLSRRHVALLNTDGTVDTTYFINGVGTTAFNATTYYVNSVAIQSDGKPVIGGKVIGYSEDGTTSTSAHGGILRLTNTTVAAVDTAFTSGTGINVGVSGTNNRPRKIVIQPDGKILVGYESILSPAYNGTTIPNGLFRLNSDGTLDTSFNSSGAGFTHVSAGTPANVFSTELQPDGKILVGGYFDTYNGTTIGSGIVRLLSTSDSTPPTLSLPSPSGTLSVDTTATTLSITTDESATCKYDTVASTAYASMSGTFDTTGGTTHTEPLTGLTNSTSYSYYVRCIDTTTNANTSDYSISFSVDTPPRRSGGGGGLLIYSTPVPTPSVVTPPPSTDTTGCTATSLYSTQTGVRCPTVSLPTLPTPTFTRDLYLTMVGEDVKALQIFLNSNGFTVNTAGWGSKGQESIYFGKATEAALQKFQVQYGITPSKGYFGVKTRGVVGQMITQ